MKLNFLQKTISACLFFSKKYDAIILLKVTFRELQVLQDLFFRSFFSGSKSFFISLQSSVRDFIGRVYYLKILTKKFLLIFFQKHAQNVLKIKIKTEYKKISNSLLVSSSLASCVKILMSLGIEIWTWSSPSKTYSMQT